MVNAKMTTKMIVLKDFEQMYDGEVEKFIKGQEITGPKCLFLHYKKGDEYLAPTSDSTVVKNEKPLKKDEEIFKEEKAKEEKETKSLKSILKKPKKKSKKEE